MFLRLQEQKHNGKAYRYYQVCRSHRVEGRVRCEVVAHLGALTDQEAEQIGRKLLQSTGSEALFIDELSQGEYRLVGGPALVEALGQRSDVSRLLTSIAWGQRSLDVPTVLGVAVAAQLLAPSSELAKSRWQTRLWNHGQPCCIPYHHFLRALRALDAHKTQIEDGLFARAQDLFHQEVDVVFCDLTSSYWHGVGPPELSKRGYSRDKRPERPQCVISLAMTRHGFPIGWDVYPGNTVDVKTVVATTDKLKQRFKIGHCIFVGDSGLTSKDNIKQLDSLEYGYILGLRSATTTAGRQALQATRHQEPLCHIDETPIWQLPAEAGAARYVVLNSPGREHKTLHILERKLGEVKPKLESLRRDVESGKVKDHDTIIARATRTLTAAKATPYVTFTADDDGFRWSESERAQELRMDAGKYVLQTNDDKLSAIEVVEAYRMLNLVEQAFRALKSTFRLRPIFHRRQEQTRGHIGLCVLALFLRACLHDAIQQAHLGWTPEQALTAANDVLVTPLDTPRGIVWPKPHVPPKVSTLLHALGVEDLARAFTEEAKHATHGLQCHPCLFEPEPEAAPDDSHAL